MRHCLNCYNSIICRMKNKEKYDKHHNEDTDNCTCKDWEDDSVDYDED